MRGEHRPTHATPWRRLKVLPFETLVALFAAYSGAVALLDIGPTATALTLQLPTTVVATINVLYLIAGLALLYGIARPKRKAEAFGLTLVLGSVAVRTVAIVWLVGITQDVVNGLVLNLMTLVFVAFRLSAVVRGVTIVQVEPNGEADHGSA